MIKLKPKFIGANQLAVVSNSKTAAKTNTITKNTVVTVTQSEELVQTLLLTSFSCLTYLRGLFADDNFYDEKFTVKPSTLDSSIGSQGGASSQKSRDAIRIKKLKRGISSEGDLFLNWVERGVFDAFHHKYLKALMFTIFLDPQNPSDIIELYTFSFSYNKDDNIILQTEGRIGSHAIKMGMNTTDIRRDMQSLIRKFIMIVQSLGPLPERRYLSMKLIYNDSAPEEYQPPFFRDCSTEVETQFLVHQNEDICTLKAGCVNAGFHAISVNVTSIIESDFGNKKCASNSSRKKIVKSSDFIEPEFEWESHYGNRKEKSTLPGPVLSSETPKVPQLSSTKVLTYSQIPENNGSHFRLQENVLPASKTSIPAHDTMINDLSIDSPSRIGSSYEEMNNIDRNKIDTPVEDAKIYPLSQVTENLKNMFTNSLPDNFDLTQYIPDSIDIPGNKDETTDDEEETSFDIESTKKANYLVESIEEQSKNTPNSFYGYTIDCICHKNAYLDICPAWAKCTKCNCLSHLYCYGYVNKMDKNLTGTTVLDHGVTKEMMGLHECYSCFKGIKNAELPLKAQLTALVRKIFCFYQKEEEVNLENQIFQICDKANCNPDLVRLIHQLLVDEDYVKVEDGVVLPRFGKAPFRKTPYNKPLFKKFHNNFYNPNSTFDLSYKFPECIDVLYNQITGNNKNKIDHDIVETMLEENNQPSPKVVTRDQKFKRQKISVSEDPLKCYLY